MGFWQRLAQNLLLHNKNTGQSLTAGPSLQAKSLSPEKHENPVCATAKSIKNTAWKHPLHRAGVLKDDCGTWEFKYSILWDLTNIPISSAQQSLPFFLLLFPVLNLCFGRCLNSPAPYHNSVNISYFIHSMTCWDASYGEEKSWELFLRSPHAIILKPFPSCQLLLLTAGPGSLLATAWLSSTEDAARGWRDAFGAECRDLELFTIGLLSFLLQF